MIQGIKISRGTSNLNGTATAGNVLSGKTFYNTDSNEELTGTMPNHGAISKIFTPAATTQNYVIPEGYHNGKGKVNVNAVNIKNIISAFNAVHQRLDIKAQSRVFSGLVANHLCVVSLTSQDLSRTLSISGLSLLYSMEVYYSAYIFIGFTTGTSVTVTTNNHGDNAYHVNVIGYFS